MNGEMARVRQVIGWMAQAAGECNDLNEFEQVMAEVVRREPEAVRERLQAALGILDKAVAKLDAEIGPAVQAALSLGGEVRP